MPAKMNSKSTSSSSADYSYDDECPITLEPLKDLPYPPFLLASSNSTKHYFDGAALAAFIVSQGAFTNPLTREPLKYEDCVLLDEYLDEYVFNGSNYSKSEKISVREAFSLRESIKAKVTSSGENEHLRAEALRNEASVALRGLFVFGHERSRRRSKSDDNVNSQILPRTAGGFNLYHNPDSSLSHSWGLGSTNNQEGLLIIDDDEAAHEAADIAAWREVQDEFPFLGGIRPSTLPTPCDQSNNMPSQILATVRHTADITIKEQREKEDAAEKARQRYFLEALERKRRRIDARRKAKGDIAKVLVDNKKAEAVQNSARAEIDRWLSQKWNEWETNTLEIERKQKTSDDAVSTSNEPCEVEISQKRSPTLEAQRSELTEEEKAAKAAAKKKAKRQKAKERAKEKKQLEKLERAKKERAMALQREKENSSTKCAHCGRGILGSGFDKFDKKYCSTKCARSASK